MICIGAWMVIALTLFHIVFFALLASYNYLVITEIAMIVLDLIYFETWLLGFLSGILKIPRFKDFLEGNASMIILQGVGFLPIRSFI